jgi:oxidase EvaA
MKKMYKKQLKQFLNIYSESMSNRSADQKEMAFERMYTGNNDNTIDKVISWFKVQQKQSTMTYEVIPLADCKGWSLDESGSLAHSSGEFFRVEGIRISNTKNREVKGGWDQPILTQVGYDGGILGLIRKRINDVPHYLVEAKSEPGNYGITQISTSLQATFSNIKQAHKGDKTAFSDLFMDPENNGGKLIFKRWMSEDGGRLLNKRNLSMVVEVDNIDLPEASDRYNWVTLNQLIEINRTTDSIIAPHIRGILSAL